MSRIGFGQNIGVLQALRSLTSASQTLARTNERLASGQRINRASDDAAGLAISQGLSAASRVYGQGIRNFNDGISLLNVADGALETLQSILVRQTELAQQAATGTLSASQRNSLNLEFTGLRNEYTRIIEGTKFNGLRLLDGSTRSVRLQGGSSSNESINVRLPAGSNSTSQLVGTGSYSQKGIGIDATVFVAGDLNSDGYADFVTAEVVQTGNDWDLYIKTYVGDGTGSFNLDLDTIIFSVSNPLASISNVSLALHDTDGDQLDDINVMFDWDDGLTQGLGTTGYMRNLGGGSFDTFDTGQSGGNYQTGMGQNHYVDINGDGVLDYIVVGNSRVDTGFIQLTTLQTSVEEGISQSLYNISTVTGARNALTALDSLRSLINSTRGEIGAGVSRLSFGINHLRTLKEGYDAARFRITDIDVAETVALQTRALIQQDLATKVLRQSSQLPQLLLDLLR